MEINKSRRSTVNRLRFLCKPIAIAALVLLVPFSTPRETYSLPGVSTVPVNSKGEQGLARAGKLLVHSESPVDIASVQVDVVPPGKWHAGDLYRFEVKTSAIAKAVYLEMDGSRYDLKGSDTKWTAIVKINRAGRTKFVAAAINQRDVTGNVWAGEIQAIQKAALPADIVNISVIPQKGLQGNPFRFRAETNHPALNVMLTLEGNTFKMTGAGTDWHLSKKFKNPGTRAVSVTAYNETGIAGRAHTVTVAVLKDRFRLNTDGTITDNIDGKTTQRFVDHQNGTVSDQLTGLMWIKAPKALPETYSDAEKYCRGYEFEGHRDWRMPTIDELERLTVNPGQKTGLTPDAPFSMGKWQPVFWSSTPYKESFFYNWKIDMASGRRGRSMKSSFGMVWPVRRTGSPDELQ